MGLKGVDKSSVCQLTEVSLILERRLLKSTLVAEVAEVFPHTDAVRH